MDLVVAVGGILMGLFLVYRAFGGKGHSIPEESSGAPSERGDQIRAAGPEATPGVASSRLVKCTSCGARVSRKENCDYCGAHLP